MFICRQFRVEAGGISADGIGFTHPGSMARLLVFAHALTPSVSRPIRYTLAVETADFGVIGEWPYTLMPTKRTDRRLLLAWFPVKGVLAPGVHNVIIEIEGQVQARTGFEIE
jgi:hypothetical protein